MATPVSEAHEIATQNGEAVPAVRKSVFGGHEQVYQDESRGIQAQSLSEPLHKSLNPEEQNETDLESTEDLAESPQPIPSVQSEQTQETKLATADAEDAAISDSGIAGLWYWARGTRARVVKDATSAGPENPRDVDTRAVVEDRPTQVTTENCVQTNGDDNDNWLDDWDLVVHRCVHCDRSFGTQQRLKDHLRLQHAPGSEPLELYLAPNRPDTAKSSNTETPIVKIVENGDLILDFQLNCDNFLLHKRFQVASQALWAASPVFNAMFGPTSKFQERVNIRRANVFGYPPSVISLQDDPDAMECVLNVLFHRRSSLATTYTFADTLNIAIVTDKYEMQEVMAGWAEPLLPVVKSWAGEPGHENALFISWVFGYDDIFESVFSALTLQSQIVNNSLFLPPPAVALSEHTPSVVMQKLVEVRKNRVQRMRNLIQDYHVRHVLSSSAYFSFCSRDWDQKPPGICSAIQIGHFIRTYNDEDLESETFWSQKVVDIASHLLAIKPMIFPDGIMDLPSKSSDYPHTITSKPRNAHAACSWHNRVAKVAEEAQLPSEKYTVKLSDFPSRKRA